ncbi:Atg6 BARA domain-containing protein [Entamoeba marina]
MKQNSLLLCHECKKLLYSHIDLSKTINHTLDNDHRDANCSLVAENGFQSSPFLCDDCFHVVKQRINDIEIFEEYHQSKWEDLQNELKQQTKDIGDIEMVLQGYENTKQNEEETRKLRELQEQSYEQLKELLHEIDIIEQECILALEYPYWEYYNELLSEIQKSVDEEKQLTQRVNSLQEELQMIESRNVFGSLFTVHWNVDYPTLSGYPFKYSIEHIEQFNLAMGQFTLGLYLLGNQIYPTKSALLIPYGNRSQIVIYSDSNKKVYNLYATIKSFYNEIDESFGNGFQSLMIYFSNLYDICVQAWPRLKDKYHYEIKTTTMCIYDTNEKKSYSFIFDPNKIDEWNHALYCVLKLFNYVLLNYTSLLAVLRSSKTTKQNNMNKSSSDSTTKSI